MMKGLVLFAGLALAGSGGEWFPWPNLAGIGLIVAFAALAEREETKRRVRA